MEIVDQVNNEASRFMTEVLVNVWSELNFEVLSKYYSPQVRIHYQNKVVGIEGIKSKMDYYKLHINALRRLEVSIENAMSFDNFIMAQLVQIGFDKKADKFFLARSVIVYRLKDKIIHEAWLTSNASLPYEVGYYDDNSIGAERKNAVNYLLKILPKSLSKRELDCLLLVLDGKSAKEIAVNLNISQRTVETYLEKIKIKLGCYSKNELRDKLFPLGLWL